MLDGRLATHTKSSIKRAVKDCYQVQRLLGRHMVGVDWKRPKLDGIHARDECHNWSHKAHSMASMGLPSERDRLHVLWQKPLFQRAKCFRRQ